MVGVLLGKRGHHHDELPKKTKKSTRKSVDKQLVDGVNDCPTCCSADPVKQLNDVHRMASVIEHEIEDAAKQAAEVSNAEEEQEKVVSVDLEDKSKMETVDEENIPAAELVEPAGDSAENKRLHKMGLNTALAIGLHNFPEGMCERNAFGP